MLTAAVFSAIIYLGMKTFWFLVALVVRCYAKGLEECAGLKPGP